MRLNQYLAACGLGSRRRCEEFVRAGRVTVNGALGSLGLRVGADDRVLFDGHEVRPVSSELWMLHKPLGVLSTAHDTRGRTTVVDLARKAGLDERLYPVGRLDLDTTGLLLLTNDGPLTHRLLHPSGEVEKEYVAEIDVLLTEDALGRLRQGIELEEGRTSPCTASQSTEGDRVLVRLVIHEGRKRQVRRMLAALGAPVRALKRIRLGPLELGPLPPGGFRALTSDERTALQTLTQKSRGTT